MDCVNVVYTLYLGMEHSTACLYIPQWGLWGLLPVLNWLQYHFNVHSLNPLCREEDLRYPFFLNISASWTSAASSLLPVKMSSPFLHYKPHSKAMFWNNKHLLSHTPTCVGQESGSALSAWFWLRVSRKVAVIMCAKVAVIGKPYPPPKDSRLSSSRTCL